MQDIRTDNTEVSTAFPPHEVSPEKKREKWWGLQGAMAAWFHNEKSAPSLFYNDRDAYETYLRYAFGEHDSAKPKLGVNNKNETQSFLGGIRWDTKNFATKRIQSTVSKTFARKYDPVATAVDPTSSDRRESFRASVKTWSAQQQWLLERQQMLGVDMAPEGVDISNLPTSDDDLEIFMQDYKLSNEINLEVGIKWHLQRLEFDENVKEKFDQYLTILPVAGVWTGMDENFMPMIKALNPARIVAPRSEFNNFKRLAYAGYVDEYTVAEFRQMVGSEFTSQEITQIANENAHKGNYHRMRFNAEYPGQERDVDTMMIMHFEIRTVDEYTFLQKKDKYGNDRLLSKPFTYYRQNPEDFRTKYKEERKLHRIRKPTVYGGYWIVGSKVIFGYGEKPNCKGELGYKLRAANSLSGHSTCLIKQMKPCLDNLETYDKKIQQAVASAIPRAIKIDLFALRKASFEFRGKNMKTEDLLDLFFQSGIIVVDSSDAPNGDTRKPLEIMQGAGLNDDVVNYVTLMRHELEQLDEIIGYNRVSAGATLSPDTGARVAQQMEIATDVNLDHLFRADRALCTDVIQALGYLHRESVLANPQIYVPILGDEAVSRIVASPLHEDIGISIEARPTQEEWNQFYAELEGLVKAEKIEPEDRVVLRRFQSLKQAEAYLKVVTKRRKRENLQIQSQLVQENAQAQQASNEQTHQNKMQEELAARETLILKAQLDDQRKDKDHRQKMQQLALQISMQNQGGITETLIETEAKKQIAKSRPAAK